MSTVGYGDFVPRRCGARFFSSIFMLLGVGVVAWFTAEITSLSTATRFAGQLDIKTEADLEGKLVSVQKDSASLKHAIEIGAQTRQYLSSQLALDALIRGEVKAMMEDGATTR